MNSSIQQGAPLFRRYGYWIFAVVGGIMLVVLDDLDIEPFFSITAFLYWSLLFYWAARWLFAQFRATLKQKKEKTNIELLHLQSQVSPHFFFNTLNNLYGLVEKDAKQAQQMILKLSDMMRYSIYDGQKEMVPLEHEIDYLSHYMALHTARYHKKIDVQFTRDIQKPGIRVKPLLFIILVENAFKHGVETLRQDAYVHISLAGQEHEIRFSIENNFDDQPLENMAGIGLDNLRRRLALVYPKKHTLSHTVANNVYAAHLTLTLI